MSGLRSRLGSSFGSLGGSVSFSSSSDSGSFGSSGSSVNFGSDPDNFGKPGSLNDPGNFSDPGSFGGSGSSGSFGGDPGSFGSDSGSFGNSGSLSLGLNLSQSSSLSSLSLSQQSSLSSNFLKVGVARLGAMHNLLRNLIQPGYQLLHQVTLLRNTSRDGCSENLLLSLEILHFLSKDPFSTLGISVDLYLSDRYLKSMAAILA